MNAQTTLVLFTGYQSLLRITVVLLPKRMTRLDMALLAADPRNSTLR